MGLEERTQTRVIDGVNYKVTPLAFGVGRKALVRFVSIAGPVMSAVVEKRGTIEQAGAAFLKMIPAVLKEEDIVYFAREFGMSSKYDQDGKWLVLTEDIQELHFAGRYGAFFGWIAFCVEVNFGSFFSEMTRQAGTAVSKAKEAIAST